MSIDYIDPTLDGTAVYHLLAPLMDRHANAFDGMVLENAIRGDDYQGPDWYNKTYTVTWCLADDAQRYALRSMRASVAKVN